MLRIGRGAWKGRVLRPSLAIRPSSGLIRAAALDIAGTVEGSFVWDLCCGSGVFGIECLSAGAVGCAFVDSDRACMAFVRKTVEALGGAERACFLTTDVTSLDLSVLSRPDIVFIDPPYRSTAVHGWAFGMDWGAVISGRGIVILETPSTHEAMNGWTFRRYGDSTLVWRWFGK